jgi:hypothetical protein
LSTLKAPPTHADFPSSSPVTDWRAASGGQTPSAVKESHDVRHAQILRQKLHKIADVRGGPLQVRIAFVEEGQYGRPNLVFESGEVLSLNATNNKILIRAYGPNSDDWIGKDIELFRGEIEYQKKMQEAVMVRPISPPLTPKTDFADEIPF